MVMRALLGALAVLLCGCSDYSLEVRPEVPEDAAPEIEVWPAAIDFGAVTAGVETVREVRVRNLGQALLSVDALRLEGAGGFTLLEDPGRFALEAATERTLEVVFVPDGPDAREGVLSVDSNDPERPTVDVPLVGEGLVPWLRITPENHDFGTVAVPCTEDLELVLQNVGNMALTVEALEYSGGEQLLLVDGPETPFVLVPGEVTTAVVQLRASAPGEVAGTLVAGSDDPRGDVSATQAAAITWVGEGSETFVVPEDPPVDILFAVDRSASMDDDAVALGEAFTTFIHTIGGVTGGWRVGVVTYDHGCFNEGILEATTSGVEARFADAVVAGCDSEIVLDEQLFQLVDRALQQTVPGACNEGFLRSGALLHVVVVSDEPERSTETASAWTWEHWLGRFQGYVDGASLLKVSGVVDLDDCNEGAAGYLEAISATGGEALTICDADWGAHADALAEASTGMLLTFALSQEPDPASIEVTVEGAVVSGWSWDATTNAVVFGETLTASVPGGSVVVVSYGLASEGCG